MAGENKVIKIELGDELKGLADTSPKEQMKRTLEFMRNTHKIENLGEEKISDIGTYHLKSLPMIFQKMQR